MFEEQTGYTINVSPYVNITTVEIYDNILRNYCAKKSPREKASAWVEAENIMLIREIISQWFESIEDSSVEGRMMEPGKNYVSQEEADDLILTIDDDFNKESGRFSHLGVTSGPDFSKRLTVEQRIMMAQEILDNLPTFVEIKKIAKARLKKKDFPADVLDRIVSLNLVQKSTKLYVGESQL